MPIYEYHCLDCGKDFEMLKFNKEPEPQVCPYCNSQRINKIIKGGSFRLEGGGWYATDLKKCSDKEEK